MKIIISLGKDEEDESSLIMDFQILTLRTAT
jgi:hypothetical protein